MYNFSTFCKDSFVNYVIFKQAVYWSEEEQRVPHLNMNIKSKFDLMQKPASRGQSLSGQQGGEWLNMQIPGA